MHITNALFIMVIELKVCMKKKYMVLNKIYIELLKFVDFDFSEFSKIAKNRLNYISAKEKTVIRYLISLFFIFSLFIDIFLVRSIAVPAKEWELSASFMCLKDPPFLYFYLCSKLKFPDFF